MLSCIAARGSAHNTAPSLRASQQTLQSSARSSSLTLTQRRLSVQNNQHNTQQTTSTTTHTRTRLNSIARRSYATESKRPIFARKLELPQQGPVETLSRVEELTEKQKFKLWQRAHTGSFKNWREALQTFLDLELEPNEFGYRWPLIPPEVTDIKFFEDFRTAPISDANAHPNRITFIPVAPERGSKEHERVIAICWDLGVSCICGFNLQPRL